jgi:hypothetical protein
MTVFSGLGIFNEDTEFLINEVPEVYLVVDDTFEVPEEYKCHVDGVIMEVTIDSVLWNCIIRNSSPSVIVESNEIPKELFVGFESAAERWL